MGIFDWFGARKKVTKVAMSVTVAAAVVAGWTLFSKKVEQSRTTNPEAAKNPIVQIVYDSSDVITNRLSYAMDIANKENVTEQELTSAINNLDYVNKFFLKLNDKSTSYLISKGWITPQEAADARTARDISVSTRQLLMERLAELHRHDG